MAAKGGTGLSGGWWRTPVTVTSNAASRRAIWVPTAPAPTMQAAVPVSERPAGSPHRPGSKPFEASGRRRASARRRATACSATGTALRPGMLATHTPSSAAASRSMLSTPTPNCWMRPKLPPDSPPGQRRPQGDDHVDGRPAIGQTRFELALADYLDHNPAGKTGGPVLRHLGPGLILGEPLLADEHPQRSLRRAVACPGHAIPPERAGRRSVPRRPRTRTDPRTGAPPSAGSEPLAGALPARGCPDGGAGPE